MKKILSSFVVAVFAVAMMAGGAWAASTLTKPAAAIVLSAELGPKLASSNFDFQTSVAFETQNAGDLVSFTTGIGLNDGDKLTFELSNGLFMEDAYFLVDAADAPAGAVKTSLGSVISSLDSTNGVSSVTFRIENGPLANGTEIVIVNALDAGVAVASAAIAVETIQIRASSALNDGDKIRIRITGAEDVGGTALPGANSSYEDLIELESQFTVDVSAVTSTIDVEQERVFFFGGVEAITSMATVDINNDADSSITDWIVLDASDSFTLTLTTDDISGIDFTDATTTFWDDSTGANAQALVLVGLELSATVNGVAAQITARGGSDENVVTITVDGETTLATRVFAGTLAIDFDSSDHRDAVLSLGDTHTWDINGYQATMPFLLQSGIQKTFVKFFNNSSLDAEIFVDLSSADGTIVANNVLLDASLLAGTVGSYNGVDIAALASIPEGTNFTATFTVTAPKTGVVGTAFFNLVGSGTRALVLQ